MAQQNRRRRLFRLINVAGVSVVALAVVFLSLAAQAKDNPGDFTSVYGHTYDEVFQAAQQAIERLGWFVTNTDKDKGIITGKGGGTYMRAVFELHIETISAKPETRITMTKVSGIFHGWKASFAGQLFSETQKVLATYK